MAQQMGLPFLGRLPINTRLRFNSDAGDPSSNFTGDDALPSELEALAQNVAAQATVAAMQAEQAAPSLHVH